MSTERLREDEEEQQGGLTVSKKLRIAHCEEDSVNIMVEHSAPG
jgi:hypothetical protein